MKCRWQAALAIAAFLATGLMGCDPDVEQVYRAETFQANLPRGLEIDLPYRLMSPQPLDSAKRYPLVLFLHGGGERGRDNLAQLRYLPTWLASRENRGKYPCFVLAPQCPDDTVWSTMLWDDDSQALTEMAPPLQAVVKLLDDVIKHYPIDPARIYLTGSSMGGYGSWELAERMPERFAAVAPICGGGDEDHADRLVDLPVWAWHGDEDESVPVRRSRRMIAAIQRAGGQPKYTELPGVGHDCWTAAYQGPDNLLGWLFAQSKSSTGK